jgi:oligosaccharide repeat unit polymerase
MIIMLIPVIYDHIHPTDNIENPNTRILTIISIVIIVSSILQIPDIVANKDTGLMQILNDTETGKDAYMEQIEEAGNAGSAIRNLPAIVYNTFSDIAVFLCFYYLTLKNKNYWLISLLFISIFVGIIKYITMGQRGGVIISLLTIFGGYMLFKRYLSSKMKNVIQGLGIILVIFTALPIVTITISRFGEEKAGISGFVNWYIGQGSLYFNNYGLNAGGTRHGDRTINLLKRVIDKNTPRNYVERRDKYHNLQIDDNYFSTYVGDFTIDFGPFTSVIIFVLFAIFVTWNIRTRDGTIKLHQLLLLYFALCISMQGGMTLFSYADSGNLRIVVLMLLYSYLRYHEKLLAKFPLKKLDHK